jgi:hypothetical protein
MEWGSDCSVTFQSLIENLTCSGRITTVKVNTSNALLNKCVVMLFETVLQQLFFRVRTTEITDQLEENLSFEAYHPTK